MKLFITGTLPEAMLSLISLEPEMDKVVLSTSHYATRRLQELGIPCDTICPELEVSQETSDKIGHDSIKAIGNASVDGYNLADGLYPDRLRFWVQPNVTLVNDLIHYMKFYDEVYIETNLQDAISWNIAKRLKLRGSIVSLVKSDELIYSPEFLYIDMFQFDRIFVPHERDVRYLKTITKRDVIKIGTNTWKSPARKALPTNDIVTLRTQLGVQKDDHVIGIVYYPSDDWKLLTLFEQNNLSKYILFFREKDRTRFNKSIPQAIRDSSMFNFDGFSLTDVCNDLLFPRFTSDCDNVAQHVKIVFYDFNDEARTSGITEAGVI